MNFDSECQKRVLAALIEGGALSTVGLALKTGLGLRSSAKGAGMLVMRGYVERSPEGDFSATADGIAFQASGEAFRSGPIGPHRRVRPKHNTFIQRVWTAMRLRRRFTLEDIVNTAAMPGEKSAYGAAQRYIYALRKAEIVAQLPRRAVPTSPTSNGCALFSLVRDTGELAPALRRDGSVFDRNGAAT